MEFYQPSKHTDAQLQAAIQDHPKVIVFLQADWCGDCKAIKPFVKELRQLAEQKGAFWIDADRDANIEFAKEQGLRGIPAFILFDQGQQKAHIGNGERLAPQAVQAWLAQEL
ncbi:thioredoxin family protein [Weissella halotolerans]|uniref:Thioredoxin domain-containing protein n=1 Tax=Weissella halotolerans DSM 20190 TaxID=1123500 RepID=A0A0R2FYP0_9LACO|nr:thioredoxin family protein [Weissella halotolerans]KRN33585.1 hypothetical protein IV68_GL000391 [Weissella halotolerans DSM 20190]